MGKAWGPSGLGAGEVTPGRVYSFLVRGLSRDGHDREGRRVQTLNQREKRSLKKNIFMTLACGPVKEQTKNSAWW